MPTGTIVSNIALAGINAESTATRTESGQISHEEALPAGKTGTLTTRSTASNGVATLEADHGVTDSDFVDVYWVGGMRYNMDVTGVSTNDVTIDGGTGTDLPATTTALIVTPRVEIDIDFDGDNVEMIAAINTKRGHVEFAEGDDTSIYPIELLANEAWDWMTNTGVTNPLTGNPVGKIYASCGEATASTFKIGVLYDSTP